MTTIDYGPDVADLRTRLAGAHTEIGRLQDECLRIAEERDARPAITREDAAIYRHATGEGSSALWRVERALAAHAKGGE